MSQSSSTQRATATESPYASDRDWWYDERDDDGTVLDADDQDDDSENDDEHAENLNKWAWVAHGMLKDHAPLFCPIAADERDAFVEIGDPEAYPPREKTMGIERDRAFNSKPRRHRVNKEDGFMPSGPLIGNRETPAVQKDIWGVLEGAYLADDGLSMREVQRVWARCMAMKRAGANDQTIFSKMAKWVRNPRLLFDEDN